MLTEQAKEAVEKIKAECRLRNNTEIESLLRAIAKSGKNDAHTNLVRACCFDVLEERNGEAYVLFLENDIGL